MVLTVAEAGRKGGKARLKTMTPEERSEVAASGGKATAKKRSAKERSEAARKAATARWESILDSVEKRIVRSKKAKERKQK